MPASLFVDTNVLLYSFDSRHPLKYRDQDNGLIIYGAQAKAE